MEKPKPKERFCREENPDELTTEETLRPWQGPASQAPSSKHPKSKCELEGVRSQAQKPGKALEFIL